MFDLQAAIYGICMARSLSDDRITERLRILGRARRSRRGRRKQKITREVLQTDMKEQPQHLTRCMRSVGGAVRYFFIYVALSFVTEHGKTSTAPPNTFQTIVSGDVAGIDLGPWKCEGG